MWFSIIGIIALVLGVLYWFYPAAIEKLNKVGQTVIISTDKFIEKRKILGLLYLLAGITLISIGILK
ncbi:MAG: hypothetical protein ABH862_01965 [Candidatus Omnitrophota bacterium]